ncbi:AAA family ATPase [Aliifodinibius sp. S!AR15-10]|uniref:Lon protease family protein n=1 Tax=Aliifodinibius sp. S!AR15-10 TaxID=2950437 RepID=UPI00285F9788|nr:ATP-binding protein [Aliifodinibius sp. S!AR15-10]MDR8393926.1 AAA family ATPase [Aliifodinibius sp. S!AR15-10]
MRQLDKTSLRQACETDQFDFKTTEEVSNLTTVLGQERLTSSMEFGMEIDKEGYNIFALGPNQTDKRSHIQQLLNEKSKNGATPDDICYINNFDDRYKPKLLTLPAGRGTELKKQMVKLIDELPPTLKSAFETEEYQNRQQALQDEVQQQQDQTFEELQNKAREKGLSLMRTPAGFSFAPIDDDGELMNEEDIRSLPEEKREELQETTRELQQELQDIIRKMPANKRKMREKKKELDKEIATFAVKDLFNEVREQFEDLEKVQSFLDDVEIDVIENVHGILGSQGQQGQNKLAQMMGGGGQQQMQQSPLSSSTSPVLDRYRVNLLVDNSETEGAPVIYEDNPSYKNLVGRVEYQSKMGALTTNFNMIKPGALHKANGGYLILNVREVLLEPFAWEGLKRALKSGELKIESLGESYSMISTVSLEPAPIDIDVKVILFGQRMLYYLLCQFDPEFQKLFKVEADFEDEIERNEEGHKQYVRFLAGLIKENDLRHFDKQAVAKIIEQSSRMVGDNEKLSTKTEEVKDLLIESDYWAGKNGHEVVKFEDVEKAIEQKIYRSARLRDKVQESINRDYIYIDTEGESVGQVNGLSVVTIGNLMFGRPNRITARVELGKGEIINIEREVDMSGPIHSKGVLILKGYLGERYATEQPLSMSASLVFEQSYSNIDGDSASAAELCALLSAIGKIPIKQSFGITGSVNQHGKIQPIGGVNEKIEGFFDICQQRGLTGDQGVLIPETNEKNLMLRNDILGAVEENNFHIYSISTIEEAMELLTGLEMGKADEQDNYPEGTINHQIRQQLDQLADNRKAFVSTGNDRT